MFCISVSGCDEATQPYIHNNQGLLAFIHFQSVMESLKDIRDWLYGIDK